MPLVLATAILIWRRGDVLPVDIHTELLSMGYDVQALSAIYST